MKIALKLNWAKQICASFKNNLNILKVKTISGQNRNFGLH